MRRILVLLCLVALATAAAAERTLTAESAGEAATLTVYSGREEKFVQPLFDRFTQLTGIELRVRYGDSAELAATIAEEGGNSPADLFFSQDAGALGVLGAEGRLRVLPDRTLARVGRRFRAPGKRWVGTSGRARVVAYNTDALRRDELPRTIWGYTNPRFRGKIGLPPTNASFQAFVTAMRLTAGEDRTRDWLTAIRANQPKLYAKNSQILTALASREIEVGFVNHYYLYQLLEQQPDAPVRNQFFQGRDPGALVNVAGVGIVATTKQGRAAQRLVDFLLGKEAQRYFAQGPGRAEYPLVPGIKPRVGLPGLRNIQGPNVSLGSLGRQLERTLQLLNEVGFTR